MDDEFRRKARGVRMLLLDVDGVLTDGTFERHGDDLLTQNFPMIHAVGRASSRAPRLIVPQRRLADRDESAA